MDFRFGSLRNRKVVHWLVGYAGAAWLSLQVYDVLKEPLSLSRGSFNVLAVVLLGGLPLTLLLAWYHGEKGRQRVSGLEVLLIAAILAVTSAFATLAHRSGESADPTQAAGDARGRIALRDLQTTTIAVFPFAVRGGDETDLSEALASLLSSRLDGAGELTTLDPNAVFARTGSNPPVSPRAAAAVAATLEAGAFVVGDAVAAPGERLHVRASLYHTNGTRELARVQAEGRADSVFALVDSVAIKLLTAVYDADMAHATTTVLPTRSLAAFKQYLKAERIFRHGTPAAAAESFEEAIALDTLFALALYRLAVVAEWGGGRELLASALQRAERLTDRLPARERLLIAAAAARHRGDLETAESVYASATQRYPQDREGWFGLGETLLHGNAMRGRRALEARVPLERAFALAPAHGREALFHLIAIATSERETTLADSLVTTFLTLFGESEFAALVRMQHLLANMTPARRDTLFQLIATRPARAVMFALELAAVANVDLHPLIDVARYIAQREQDPQLGAAAWRQVASFEAGRGRLPAMQSAFEEAAALDAPATVLARASLYALPYLPLSIQSLRDARDALQLHDASPVPRRAEMHLHAGRLSIRLGDMGAAERHASALERMATRSSPDSARTRRMASLLRAHMLAASSRPHDALRALDAAGRYFDYAPDRLLRAELLAQTGSARAALSWFASAAEAPQPFPLFAWLRHAQLSEELGDARGAAASYARALLQLDHAESAVAELARDARARRDRLEAAAASHPQRR